MCARIETPNRPQRAQFRAPVDAPILRSVPVHVPGPRGQPHRPAASTRRSLPSWPSRSSTRGYCNRCSSPRPTRPVATIWSPASSWSAVPTRSRGCWPSTKRGFGRRLQKDSRVRDGNGLRWWIESTTDLLSATPFDRRDESLTAAPACGVCPKRLGFDVMPLFDDGGDHPDARCGDPGTTFWACT